MNCKIIIIFTLTNLWSMVCIPLPENVEEIAWHNADNPIRIATGNKSSEVAVSIGKSVEVISPLQKPAVSLESAKLEQEGIPSKILSVYDSTQDKVKDFFNPKPIVDTIQEHEKYGNNGDKFYPVGRAIVNGYEGFSNILNKLLDAPVEIAKQFSRGITNQLNLVGGKIVGLA